MILENSSKGLILKDGTGQDSQDIISIIEPVFYYADEWFSTYLENLKFIKTIEEEKHDFGIPEIGVCSHFIKIFEVIGSSVKSSERIEILIHLYYNQRKEFIYFNWEVKKNLAKSDILAGFIHFNAPSTASAFRFFHNGNRDETPFNPNTSQLGLEYFKPDQSCWSEPALSEQCPNNENLPISFMLAKCDKHSLGFVPVNQFGQRSIIRCSEMLDIPLGLNFVAGNYLPAQKYQQVAGGIIGWNENPVMLTKNLMKLYMFIVGRPHVLREYKDYPEMFEYLGFCTWNTFYASVDMQGIRDLAEENFPMGENPHRFRYLIIDDGWQSVTGCDVQQGSSTQPPKISRGMTHFEANHKFPRGLAEANRVIKEEFGFKWLGVWHAVTGYWNGVEPNSVLGDKYALIEKLAHAYPDPTNHQSFHFWSGYYKYIRESGVDLLKIDNQTTLGTQFAGKIPIDTGLEEHYISQQGAAYAQNLTILNCMCMGSDNKIHWTKSNVSRVSDDFYPNNLPLGKHQILQCIYNPLFYSSFCWPDHDMFQTNSPKWQPLILLHCVSGGPIYIADEIEETNHEITQKLAYPDGRIGRLDLPGMPTNHTIYADPQKECVEMWNVHNLDGWGSIYYIYLVNISDQPTLYAKFSLDHIPINEASKFVSRNTETNECVVMEKCNSLQSIEIEELKAAYYQICPIQNNLAIFGLEENYNGTTAIKNFEWNDSKTATLKLSYPGHLLLYLPELVPIEITLADSTAVPIQSLDKDAHLLRVESPATTLFIEFV